MTPSGLLNARRRSGDNVTDPDKVYERPESGKPVPRSRTDSPAFNKLAADSWAVQLPRSLVTNNPFGAVLVYAATCAWRDRGPGFGYTNDEGDFIRNWAAIPPGGWPALLAVSAQTWRRWLDAAESADLIKIFNRGRRDQLLRPLTRLKDGEQFARVEVAILFHRELSQRARRTFVALSLFRQKSGFVSASIRKIGDDAGLERRDVQRALRDLEAFGALRSDGTTARGIHRYLMISPAPPDDFTRPHVVISPAPPDDLARPKVVILPALSGTTSGTSSRIKNQELISGVLAQALARNPDPKLPDDDPLTVLSVATPLIRVAAERKKAEAAKASEELLGKKDDQGGGDVDAMMGTLEAAHDPLSRALAKLGRTISDSPARSKVA